MTFSIDIVIYLLGLAFAFGGLWLRVGTLERKMDKHNSFMERLCTLEREVENFKEQINIQIKNIYHSINDIKCLLQKRSNND